MSDAQKVEITVQPVALGDAEPGAYAPQVAHAVTQKTKPLARRVTNVALVLALVAIMAFTGGAVIATAVLSGRIDLETGWVKDVITTVKTFTHKK